MEVLFDIRPEAARRDGDDRSGELTGLCGAAPERAPVVRGDRS
jgi:hypothetical protein